ncbi:hypothetical protein AB6A40_008953 [Gnathostoma spinigerum]|uniref:Uncharacterized protein n=1 Tax=Gnathostoma spinigerum TaxID=75299 RepID=A0ABD6EQJ2_9BILA
MLVQMGGSRSNATCWCRREVRGVTPHAGADGRFSVTVSVSPITPKNMAHEPSSSCVQLNSGYLRKDPYVPPVKRQRSDLCPMQPQLAFVPYRIAPEAS